MKTKVGYTPGPWHIGMRTGHNACNIYSYTGKYWYDDPVICSIPDLYLNTKLQDMPDSKGLANARLIAAAPELLEALEKCLEPTAPQTKWFEARRLIKKVKGEIT